MKLISIDLERPLPPVPRPAAGVQCVLVRLHRQPVGLVWLDSGRVYSSGDLRDAIVDRLAPDVLRHVMNDRLAGGDSDVTAPLTGRWPPRCQRDCTNPPRLRLTAAVCTRNGAARLPGCLDALETLEYPEHLLDILVVDNAPADDATERAVRGRQRIRYVREPRPGLDWARNRAVLEARGEIVAFTDDDVSVDAGWAAAIAHVFEEEPAAMCVTGLVLPDELDEDAQVLFERYGGFARGFQRIYASVDVLGGQSAAAIHGGTGKFGTGANMAFRRPVFDRIGLFDPALDVGTDTHGGGDLEMFFRILKEGHLLVYEPAAMVRHRHRRAYADLRTQLRNNGIGFYSYLVRSARAYPDERAALVRLGLWWLWFWNVRRLLWSFVKPAAFPRDLIVAELRGSLAGLNRYGRAQARAGAILREFGPQPLTSGGRA